MMTTLMPMRTSMGMFIKYSRGYPEVEQELNQLIIRKNGAQNMFMRKLSNDSIRDELYNS